MIRRDSELTPDMQEMAYDMKNESILNCDRALSCEGDKGKWWGRGQGVSGGRGGGAEGGKGKGATRNNYWETFCGQKLHATRPRPIGK